METKHLIWIIPAGFFIGLLFGFYISIPSRIDVNFAIDNQTIDAVNRLSMLSNSTGVGNWSEGCRFAFDRMVGNDSRIICINTFCKSECGGGK